MLTEIILTNKMNENEINIILEIYSIVFLIAEITLKILVLMNYYSLG